MSNKRIIDLEDSVQLDTSDYLPVYNAEPTADSFTYKVRISDLLDLQTVSVNGKTGNTITLNADDISDIGTTHKFTTVAEKNKVALIRTDLPGTFLSGNGSYQTINTSFSGVSTVIVVSSTTSISVANNFLVICDTAISGFTVNLPSVPADKQVIKVKAAGNGESKNVIVNGSGKMIQDDSTALINTNYGSIECMFINAINKWLVTDFVS